MKPSAGTPRLPAGIFIATDLALIGAAAVIAFRAEEPLTAGNVIAIVGCVGLGAVAGLVPLVARYERQKNATLDDRQRAIEGMAQTLAAAAEQVSIATASLHQINEAAQRNLQQAAQLPQQLEEKVAHLRRQVAAIQLGDLEKLEALAGRLNRAAAELAKHEAAASQQAASTRDNLARLAEGGEAIARAQAAAVAALESKLAELDARLTAAGTHASPWAPGNPEAGSAAVTVEPPAPAQPAAPSPAPATPDSPQAAEAPAAEASASAAETPAPAKRPRRPRVKDSAAVPATESAVPSEPPATTAPAPEATAEIPAEEAPALRSAAAETSEAAPKASETPPAASPANVGPSTEEAGLPADLPAAAVETDAANATPAAAAAPVVTAPEPLPEPAPRKRTPRRPQPDPEPSLDLPLEDTSGSRVPGAIERTLSSDGATRLIATAYIGIGNRLFIRGDGAGLSWDQGVPLQFVSIGKWRWETNEATGPVRFKLYKNDEQECTALGEQVLEPGHLQEMTANF